MIATKEIDEKLNKKYLILDKLSKNDIKEKYGEDFNSLLADLLFVRGVEDKKDADVFLNPKWEDNFDPFLFNDMEKVVSRILLAIENKENILIFSDYDTDGIPGGVILHDFFKKIEYKKFKNFIPNRNNDGYGLTEKAALKIVEGNIFDNDNFIPDLVITIDCGISDFESGEILSKKKIDLIITDHHIAEKKIPKSVGVLNHKVKGEKYPESILSGAGVVFKLVQALILEIKKRNFKLEVEIKDGWEKWLVDLVAIATVCDMVPLFGENRLFVKYGKIVLEKTKRKGLKKIIEKSRIDKNNITSGDIGFMIGPRINAASRLENPMIAFSALSENNAKGEESALELEKLNNRRKYLTAKIMKNVWSKLKNKPDSQVIVIGDKEWPLGVLGLIAGKIADKMKKPVFVWSQSKKHDGELKGSCRTGGNKSVYSLMEKNTEDFINFGGHEVAGGFSIEESKIHFLEKRLEEVLEESKELKKEKTIIDAEISLDEVNFENYREIEKLEPYGIGNQKPHFFFRNIEIFSVKFFGKNNDHLELIFRNSKNQNVKAMIFYYKDNLKKNEYKEGEKINLIASFELNSWNNNSYLRLKIEDIF